MREYHESLKQALYPVIFRDGAVREVDWDALPRHTFWEERTPLPAVPELGTLLALSAVLALLALAGSARSGVRGDRARDAAAAARPAGSGPWAGGRRSTALSRYRSDEADY